MRFCVLGSGSKGNCTYVASGRTAVLIDAGFSGIEVERRLWEIGIDIATIAAILVTHEHSDHVKGVAVLSKRFRMPVFANQGTKEAAGKYLDKLFDFQPFCTGNTFRFQELEIHPFAISHDCVDPVGYTVSDGNHTVGYCTDTGLVSKLIHHHLSRCQGLILECNHDPLMLKNGPYPIHVQQRVRSKNGHLANPQTVEFLKELYHDHLKTVVLAHISESNNCEHIIRKHVDDLLAQLQPEGAAVKQSCNIMLASQQHPGALIDLDAATMVQAV